jgi:death-on-curing protein
VSSQNKVAWISEAVVVAIHEAQLAEHGGRLGIRDAGLLESALMRPQMAVAYTEADVAQLAALYALGVLKNHPFIDGNKRVGAVLLETFLVLNGGDLLASDAELLRAIMQLASSQLSEDDFVGWVREHAKLTVTG